MTFAVPKLDDRQFQDIVDEAKKRIPQYIPEWTDHNVSDPGVTLIELFAWMTDMVLYRLNQVPRMHYIRFMEMFGIQLQAPQPAQALITFWLSAPQNIPVVIPAGVEVASTQTEAEQPVIFTTNAGLRIPPPLCSQIFSAVGPAGGPKSSIREYNLRRLSAGVEDLEVFSSTPNVGDALYFGFDNDLSSLLLGFDFDFNRAGGAGIDPTMPPYVWEASTGARDTDWEACEVDMDTTGGMNTAGRVRIHLPKMDKQSADGKTQYWVRVRVKEISPDEKKEGMQPYRVSPRLKGVNVATWGGDVPAFHGRQVERELLGVSDGAPGQRFQLKNIPVLDPQYGEQLVLQVERRAQRAGKDGQPENEVQVWQEVSQFSTSRASDRHFTLDRLTGELRFGPAIRQPDGTMKLYGAIPEAKARLTLECYRYGGGLEGNVQPRVLNTLKTAIPYVARVANRKSAQGGLDAETLEAAMLRLPALLSTRDRAVTAADFEFLAGQALPTSRVKCLQPYTSDNAGAGKIYLLVIPRVDRPEGFLKPELLQLRPDDQSHLQTYLDERRLLGARLDIRMPEYTWVAVKARLHAAPGANNTAIENELLARLNRFLNPLVGGPDGKGWPFGRSLYASDVYPCLLGIPGVQYILGLELYNARPGGEAIGEQVECVDLVDHGVIASGVHQVQFE